MRHMSKARLLYSDRQDFPDGGIVEMKIWRLPAADAERRHGLKYRLFYGRRGARLVGYDNERGKGDHRHIGEHEYPYCFESVEKLVADFLADVAKARGDA